MSRNANKDPLNIQNVFSRLKIFEKNLTPPKDPQPGGDPVSGLFFSHSPANQPDSADTLGRSMRQSARLYCIGNKVLLPRTAALA